MNSFAKYLNYYGYQLVKKAPKGKKNNDPYNVSGNLVNFLDYKLLKIGLSFNVKDN